MPRYLLAIMLCGMLVSAALSPALADDMAILEARDVELREFLRGTISGSNSFEDRFDAEVWLVDMSRRLQPYMPVSEAHLDLLRQVHHHAREAGLPPELVLAVIEVESHFDRFAVSRVGAQGLMQVMPFWRKEIGRSGDNLTHIATNLKYGCRILQFYLERSDGSLLQALRRYNGASNLKYSRKVQTAWRDHWSTGEIEWR